MRRIELTDDWENFDLSKVGNGACVVRYGAFGDMIQASTVFPALKEMGYHLTVNTSEKGAEIVRNDPYIDTLFVQKTNQVPNEKLDDYWARLERHFDRFINLSESVERALLAVERDECFRWNHAFRDLVFSVDYLDGAHAIAGCPDAPKRPRFYPSKSENESARKFRASLGGGNKVILWCISGSSLHKIWPHMDTVFARLMLHHPNVKIVTVGDYLCHIIEYPWENEPRVIFKSGVWSIRETLAFIPHCDIVVGPETGVMNAASYLDIPKVLIMSHSSPKNLGGNWPNTACVTPVNTPCYPCHKLHYSWKTCHRDESTGVALCASNISADAVYSEIRRRL